MGMTEIIEKLEHGIMICSATGTMLVHIDKGDAEKVVALLKEQEAVEPKEGTDPNESHWNCGGCGYPLWEDENYCAHCGKRVLWEGR